MNTLKEEVDIEVLQPASTEDPKVMKNFKTAVSFMLGVITLIYFLSIWNIIVKFPLLSKSQVHVVAEKMFAAKRHHASQMADLLKVVQFDHIKVKDANECSERRLLVYTCNGYCGGWGTRQKSMVSSFLLALLFNRTFVIDMNEPCKLEHIMGSNLYDWTACKPYLANITRRESREVQHMDSIDLSSRFLRPGYAIMQGNTRVVRFKTNVLHLDTLREQSDTSRVMGWVFNMAEQTVVRLIVHILFKNTNTNQDKLLEFKQNIVKDRTLVCAHIRKGKNPSIPTDMSFEKVRGPPNETTIFSFLRNYSDNRKFALYIASDSDDIKRKAAVIFPNYVGLNQAIMHIDRLGDKRLSPVESQCEEFATVLFEQVLLASCDVLLLTKSNFGFSAAFLRGKADGLFLFSTHLNKVIPIRLNELWMTPNAGNKSHNM